MDRLTPREIEVLRLIAVGRSTKQIASDLKIAFKTAACHRSALLSKMAVANTAELVTRAARSGFIDVFLLDSERPVPTSTLSDRIAMLREVNRRERDILQASLKASEAIRQTAQKARTEFAEVRQEMRARCQELAEQLELSWPKAKAVRSSNP